jgi:hypothetical protein
MFSKATNKSEFQAIHSLDHDISAHLTHAEKMMIRSLQQSLSTLRIPEKPPSAMSLFRQRYQGPWSKAPQETIDALTEEAEILLSEYTVSYEKVS